MTPGAVGILWEVRGFLILVAIVVLIVTIGLTAANMTGPAGMRARRSPKTFRDLSDRAHRHVNSALCGSCGHTRAEHLGGWTIGTGTVCHCGHPSAMFTEASGNG